MLKDIANIIIEGQLIVFIIFVAIASLGIFLFMNWQLVWLLKSTNSNLNFALAPLDVKGLDEELNPFGFAYALNEDFFLSIMYPWQRGYGYCKSYDEASPLLAMIIDCEPIYFKYNNRNWLIEFWKGQYGMTTGGEIGLYVADETNDSTNILDIETIYNSVSDEERIPMFYTLRKKNNVLITRNELHWWLTGFKLGEFSKPKELVMDIGITLKNEIMRDAFIIGLKDTGYKDKDITVINNTIYLTFKKPHTKQPFTRTGLVTFIMQNYNKQNCKLYNSITKDYKNSLDKINFIRSKFPLMYDRIIDFGKTEQLFKNYRPTIKNTK